MKKLLIGLTTALAAIIAAPQSIATTFWDGSRPEKCFTFGPRLGFNVSYIDGDWVNTSSKMGLNVGIAAEFPIVKTLWVSTGIFYSEKGSKIKVYDFEKGNRFKTTQKLNYIDIPIYASYRMLFDFGGQLQFNLGPYIGIGVSSNHDAYNNGIRRFDLGIGTGAAFVYKNMYVGMNYQAGELTLDDENDIDLYNYNFSMSIGYNF